MGDMREVEVSRFVRASPAEVERALSPATIVEYEGSFQAREVRETDEGWVVRAGARGLELALRFEAREDGYVFEQEGDEPLETMRTWLTYAPENEGTRVTMRSAVHWGAPPSAITDRVAAWKRRGELKRALANLAADVE